MKVLVALLSSELVMHLFHVLKNDAFHEHDLKIEAFSRLIGIQLDASTHLLLQGQLQSIEEEK